MTDVLKDASVKPREIKGYGWKPSLPDLRDHIADASELPVLDEVDPRDRKSTRLNSSHLVISYAVFCLKKKKKHTDKLVQHHVYKTLHHTLTNAPTCAAIHLILHEALQHDACVLDGGHHPATYVRRSAI